MAGDAESAPDLSPRERQILTLTARGFRVREIGHQLFRPPGSLVRMP